MFRSIVLTFSVAQKQLASPTHENYGDLQQYCRFQHRRKIVAFPMSFPALILLLPDKGRVGCSIHRKRTEEGRTWWCGGSNSERGNKDRRDSRLLQKGRPGESTVLFYIIH